MTANKAVTILAIYKSTICANKAFKITVQKFMFEKYLLELSASNIMVNKKHTSNDAQHLTIE